MTDETKNLEVAKEEVKTIEGAERTRDRRAYVPRANIYETENEIMIVADMPGVDEKTVDITLEKNELTINGYIEEERHEGYSLMYAEYGTGDYQRTCIIPNELNRDKIQASVKDGVLRLKLPKANEAKTRVIDVKAG